MGVGRISQFHAGAGIKQNQLSLPFPKSYEKRTSWDIIISPRSAARQAKSSSNPPSTPFHKDLDSVGVILPLVMNL